MKLSEISNTGLRFMSAGFMALVLLIVAMLEYYAPYIHAVRGLTVLVFAMSLYEVFKCLKSADSATFNKHSFCFVAFLLWMIFVMYAGFFVGMRPWIMLWLLMIIVGADVGGWLFGLIFGGDKMWERISSHKTWAGQIGGIVCGTIMSVLFFLFIKPYGDDVLFAVLMGISLSLLSQYGDLTASYIKRCLNIKDFSNLLPGHGGILDRVDGWIYILPLIWFFIK